MVIHHPSTALEAVMKRKEISNSVYLSGGTEDLRLGGQGEGKELIDINGLLPSHIIRRADGMIEIGALATLQDLMESDLIPQCVKKGAALCASFEKRNSATVGGNIGARRDDSYLGALFSVLDVVMHTVTPHGEEDKKVSEYFPTECRRLIVYFLLDPKKEGYIRRFGNTSSSHATLIAARCEDRYALSVKGAKMVFGSSPEIYKDVEYISDITGSKEYKKYLASIAFEGGK